MPSRLIIRLHPVEPITADVFTDYLIGLSIAAHEVSFNDPGGSGPAFGSATYIAPTILPPATGSSVADVLPTQDPDSRITQHFQIAGPAPFTGIFERTFQAVATAVIEIPTPPPGGEYQTADVRLEITRGVNDIVHKQIYYNVPVRAGGLPAAPDPNEFPSWPETSLHLALPAAGQQLSQSVVVPEDGTAPNFGNLRTAVENVLNAEPGNLADIANLTLKQCRHIAYEIIWDRNAYPLPGPTRSSLEQMYTGPQSSSDQDEIDRLTFEGDLLTYYIKHNNEAERLANFIFALSAAILTWFTNGSVDLVLAAASP